jgi:hypothetical protein
MNKQFQNLGNIADINPLTISDQSQIKGGMASSDEEKVKKAKKVK